MWTINIRLPDEFKARVEAYRRAIGARSYNEAIYTALDSVIGAGQVRGEPIPPPRED